MQTSWLFAILLVVSLVMRHGGGGGGDLGLSKRALSCHSPACKRYDPYDFRSASFWVIRKKFLCSSRKHISSKFRWRSSGKLLKNKSGGKQQPNRIKELCTER